MKRSNLSIFTSGLVALCIVFFSLAGAANALDIVLEPSSMQREIDDQVRVQIYADPAVDLISMGVKVSWTPPNSLEVVSASKYEDISTNNGWIMDADGDPATTGDQYTSPAVDVDHVNGSVTMIGGRLMGSGTAGLSGKVLLGWIVFKAKINGTHLLNVELAKYHPNDPAETFDNFVSLTAGVEEPTNVPGDLAAICVVDDACLADLNSDGSVDFFDVQLLRQELLATGLWHLEHPPSTC